MVSACFGTLLGMHTTNLECGWLSLRHIVTFKAIPQSHCKYWASISPHRSNNLTHSLDVNDQLGGTSFKSRHEGWADEPMVQDFSKWASECFGWFSHFLIGMR